MVSTNVQLSPFGTFFNKDTLYNILSQTNDHGRSTIACAIVSKAFNKAIFHFLSQDLYKRIEYLEKHMISRFYMISGSSDVLNISKFFPGKEFDRMIESIHNYPNQYITVSKRGTNYIYTNHTPISPDRTNSNCLVEHTSNIRRLKIQYASRLALHNLCSDLKASRYWLETGQKDIHFTTIEKILQELAPPCFTNFAEIYQLYTCRRDAYLVVAQQGGKHLVSLYFNTGLAAAIRIGEMELMLDEIKQFANDTHNTDISAALLESTFETLSETGRLKRALALFEEWLQMIDTPEEKKAFLEAITRQSEGILRTPLYVLAESRLLDLSKTLLSKTSHAKIEITTHNTLNAYKTIRSLKNYIQLKKNACIDQFWQPINPDTIRALVSQEMTLHELACEYGPGAVKEGLKQLNEFFKMRRIAGDGHCLFRAIFASILYACTCESKKITFLSRLQYAVDDLKSANPVIEKKYNNILTIIEISTSGKKSIDTILNHKESSNLLVSFLRDLVCAHHFIYGNEVFESEAIVYSKTKEKYLKTMMDMKKRELGGEPELVALKKILGIEPIVLHTLALGNGEKKPTAYLQQSAESADLPVFLLFQPGHYDLAFLKI